MTDVPNTSTAAADTLPPYAREALEVVASAGSDVDAGLTGAEAAERLARLGPEPDHRRGVALGLGGRARPAARPDEHHADRGHRCQRCHRPGLDRHHRRPADPAERRARVAPGAEGAGQHRRAGQHAGAAGAGGARRLGRAGAGARRRARRHRPGRGRRHRPRGRTDPPLGHPGDPGGGPHRRERPDRQGSGGPAGRATSRSATARTCCSRTPRSPGARARWW